MDTVSIYTILEPYPETIINHAMLLRELIRDTLPGIQEQPDLPARMIAYTYGTRYTDLICVILPSKKGLKLGFNKGPELPDPDGLLEGTAKTTRYVTINTKEQIQAPGIVKLLKEALLLYQKRTGRQQ